jgi:hypothetical protein
MKRPPNNKINDEPSYRLPTSADLVGTLAGVAVSSSVEGHTGAYVGGVVAVVLSQVIQEFSHRLLGTGEKRRIDDVVSFACRKIESNIVAGKQIRQDDFFTNQPDGRSSAEEIAEGVLIVSQREYEERKTPFYGNLFGNLAFTSLYDRAYSNQLLKIAEEISYRQLCLISIVRNNKHLRLQHSSLRKHHRSVSQQRLAALQELMGLHLRGLITDSSNTAWLGVWDATVDASLVELGTALYDLMELSSLRIVDVQDTAALFK